MFEPEVMLIMPDTKKALELYQKLFGIQADAKNVFECEGEVYIVLGGMTLHLIKEDESQGLICPDFTLEHTYRFYIIVKDIKPIFANLFVNCEGISLSDGRDGERISITIVDDYGYKWIVTLSKNDHSNKEENILTASLFYLVDNIDEATVYYRKIFDPANQGVFTERQVTDAKGFRKQLTFYMEDLRIHFAEYDRELSKSSRVSNQETPFQIKIYCENPEELLQRAIVEECTVLSQCDMDMLSFPATILDRYGVKWQIGYQEQIADDNEE
ncbi:MAG: hypothetical protein SNI70_11710 [Rikenellaceae bacterium]|uniref:hypothetical protein n=1 Tax=Bengtsoniella intestinalis TaxID=3073143 RepID=UPI0037B2A820